MMQKIILIRHAESEANVGEVIEHKNIVRITEKGKKQAEDLAEILDEPNRIIVSKFIRTIETAEPTIKKFPNAETHLWIDTHEFHYIDPVKFRTITKEERDNMVKEYWRKQDPFYRDAESVETFEEMVLRVHNVLKKLKTLSGINYIFTHGIIIRTMYILLENFPEFEKMEKTKELYVEIMSIFDKLTKEHIPPVDNTARFDITHSLEKYIF
jgi:broad specificity phosphatase PhoE